MKLMEENHFDVTVIDEASQALEAACWIPLLRTKKCILAGDHLQLPPTILSKEAAKEGLEVTLMERVLDLHGDKVMKMLTTQYRMNEKIMQWSSQKLYESKLVAHPSVKHHLLRDMPEVEEDETTVLPLLYIDTAGCDLHELDLPEEISKGNEGEADIVSVHVERLVSCGVRQEDIAVIAPYNLQVELVRIRLASKYPKIEVKSVDGFQGREKEAVIISLVRSNKRGEVGFLSERRRINVAVTRARRHLAVIGDSETVGKDDFLKSLIDYLNNEGEVHTAQQYLDDILLHQSEISRPEHLDDLMSLSKQQSSNKGARPKTTTKHTPVKRNDQSRKGDNQQEGKHKVTKSDSVTEEDGRLVELQTQLQQFMSNDNVEILEFPNSLSARDRFMVHELSEKLGLAHTSKGIGEDRFILVTKPGERTVNRNEMCVEENIAEANHHGDRGNENEEQYIEMNQARSKKKKKKKKHKNEDITILQWDNSGELRANDDIKQTVHASEINLAGNESENTSELCRTPAKDGKFVCHICKKDVLKANLELHEVHCARKTKELKQEKANDNKKKDVSKSTKHRTFDKELAEKIEKVDKDDIDALIETVQNMDKFCCFKKCKTSVQTLFQVCAFCEGRYCFGHTQPEVHGCGEAARAHARARISKDGVLYRGSGVPHKRSDATKQARLHRKLDSKLTELAAQRKGKPKK